MPKTIAIDFDGVLHGYSKGWQGGVMYDKPVEGAADALAHFIDQGFEVVIYSTRCHSRTVDGVFQPNEVNAMREYLSKHSIPFTRIQTEPGKPLCKLFVDDNAFRFEGTWNTENVQKIMGLLS